MAINLRMRIIKAKDHKIKMSVVLKYDPWNRLVCIEPRFLKLIPDDLGLRKCAAKPLKKRHGCCAMFLFTSGLGECVLGLLKNVYTP